MSSPATTSHATRDTEFRTRRSRLRRIRSVLCCFARRDHGLETWLVADFDDASKLTRRMAESVVLTPCESPRPNRPNGALLQRTVLFHPREKCVSSASFHAV